MAENSERCAEQSQKRWLTAMVAGLVVASSVVGCEVADDGLTTSAPDESGDERDVASDDGDDGANERGSSAQVAPGTTKPGSTGTTGAKPATKPASGASGDLYCKAQEVLNKNCVGCHDGKGTGGSPMGLTSFADLTTASPLTPGKKVFETTAARTHDTARPMPPRGVLPADQLGAIDAWVAAGAPAAPEGGCAKAELPNGQVDGWDPSLCDEVYRIQAHAPNDAKAPYAVPPGRELNTLVSIDAPWGNEPIQAIAFKPYTDNAKVLHHWILNGKGAFLSGWAPGDDEHPPLPSDVAVDMPSGARSMSLNLHYYNTAGTKTEQDKSGVDVCALKKEHFRPKLAATAMGLASIGQGGVLAPAGAKDRAITSVCTLGGTEPVHLLTANPHAHTYAVRMRFTVTKGGQEIVMHDAPFKFGEQGSYPLPGGEIVLNPGDKITTQCFYTNPTRKNVTFGESTEDEMCFNFARYYPKGALRCGGGGIGGLGGAFPGLR
ncbi:MAG: hypothetical protein ABW252_16405 [Polyangiales bacterium]